MAVVDALYGVWLCMISLLTVWFTWDSAEEAEKTALIDKEHEDMIPIANNHRGPVLKLRPYKPVFFMTMGTTRVDMSKVINLDRQHAERIRLRERLMKQYPDSTVRCTVQANAAANELYRFLVNELLPQTFPETFSIDASKTRLQDHNTGNCFPVDAESEGVENLRRIGSLIDEDFMLLQPCGETGRYTLQAYIVCFASGFSLSGLIGQSLSSIHRKVPGYKEKLETSLDRWFPRLQIGTVVRRCNWTITSHGRLRNEEGENQSYEEEDNLERSTVFDMDEFHLRTELQHLFRLPESKAIVFCYKTYLYPLSELRAEGQGPALADAIEGLRKGNTPGIAKYKGSNRWGREVCAYLRQKSVA